MADKLVDRAVEIALELCNQGDVCWFPNRMQVIHGLWERAPQRMRIRSPREKRRTENLRDEEWAEIWNRIAVGQQASASKVTSLERAFSIDTIELARTPGDIPATAAHLFREIVPSEGGSAAFSCGNTLADMVAELRDYDRPLDVFSTVVIISESATALPPSAVTDGFLRGPGQVRSLAFLIPRAIEGLLPANTAERRKGLSSALWSQLFDRVARVSSIWIGIGTLDQDGAFSAHIEETGAKEELREKGAVGECMFWPYDDEGQWLYDKLGLAGDGSGGHLRRWQQIAGTGLERFFSRTFTMPLSTINENAKRVIVAGGKHKVEALYVALSRLGMQLKPTYLVTDETTLAGLYARAEEDGLVGLAHDHEVRRRAPSPPPDGSRPDAPRA